jgi:formate dehydrogenase subunit delta
MSDGQSGTSEKLVYMANQIGLYFTAQPRGDAVADIADHIARFWEPRMRAQAFAHLDAGGAGLNPAPKAALERLAQAERTKRAG